MGDQRWRSSKKFVSFVVMVALFLDMLSVFVLGPIVPAYLVELGVVGSMKIGILFSAKALVQFFFGLFVGGLTDRIGCKIPMLLGFFIMLASTLMFTFADTYILLLVARGLQGAGVPLTSVTGLTLLAKWYPYDKERGVVVSRAYSSGCIGMILAPIFGGFFYYYSGRKTPFLIIASLSLIDGVLRLLIVDNKSDMNPQRKATSLKSVLKDPYILLTIGAHFLVFMSISCLEPLLPIHMIAIMPGWSGHNQSFAQGVVLTSNAAAFFIGLNVFGNLSQCIGKYIAALMGLILVGCSLIAITFVQDIPLLILANAAFGLAFGLVQSAVLPLLALLVDIRHSRVYGNTSAIINGSVCLATFTGPLLGGFLMDKVGFSGVLRTFAAVCFVYAPFLVFLQTPSSKQEEQPLMNEN